MTSTGKTGRSRRNGRSSIMNLSKILSPSWFKPWRNTIRTTLRAWWKREGWNSYSKSLKASNRSFFACWRMPNRELPIDLDIPVPSPKRCSRRFNPGKALQNNNPRAVVPYAIPSSLRAASVAATLARILAKASSRDVDTSSPKGEKPQSSVVPRRSTGM